MNEPTAEIRSTARVLRYMRDLDRPPQFTDASKAQSFAYENALRILIDALGLHAHHHELFFGDSKK